MTVKQKSIIYGLLASVGMSVFYVSIMFLTMTPGEVWFNFTELWYLIVGIIMGFGVQIGLWVYVKNCGAPHHHPDIASGDAGQADHGAAMSSSSGVVSGVGMVACCAHHLADVLPILGISGAAIFLTQYQRPFLVLGLSINLLGIAYMVHLLQKHKKMMISHQSKEVIL